MHHRPTSSPYRADGSYSVPFAPAFPAGHGLAEADGNRTRQGAHHPLNGFEDRGAHQEPGRLRSKPTCGGVLTRSRGSYEDDVGEHLAAARVDELGILVALGRTVFVNRPHAMRVRSSESTT